MKKSPFQTQGKQSICSWGKDSLQNASFFSPPRVFSDKCKKRRKKRVPWCGHRLWRLLVWPPTWRRTGQSSSASDVFSDTILSSLNGIEYYNHIMCFNFSYDMLRYASFNFHSLNLFLPEITSHLIPLLANSSLSIENFKCPSIFSSIKTLSSLK